jgi:hypothetical protein
MPGFLKKAPVGAFLLLRLKLVEIYINNDSVFYLNLAESRQSSFNFPDEN